MKTTVYIGSDHGGFTLKEAVAARLKAEGRHVQDLGTHSTDSCDYPHFAKAVAAAVLDDEDSLGILVCGTGIGMAMTAGKVRGVRAAVCTDTYMARMTRAHNNANILCLGERVLGPGLAADIVDTFLSTEFEGERHLRRINLIED